MSEIPQFSQQRAFHCPECKGRIVIPANLPATNGPCPHCKATIISPEPDIHSSIIDVDLTPVVESSPTPTPTPRTTVVPVTYEAPEELKEKEAEKSISPEKSDKKSSPILLILVFLLILGAIGGGAYYVIGMMKSKGDAVNTLVLKQPAKPITNPTLEKYLAASSLDEKLKHIYNAELLQPKIEAFYKDKSISETDTPANLFSLVQIPESDSKKGFIFLTYNQPPANKPADPKAQPTKIFAFLKETEQGVKLDWEVFAQTKYRTLNHFIKTPIAGKSEVFRVLVTKDPAIKTPDYLLTDPAHQTDSVQVTADPKSPVGQLLASLDQESAKISGPAKRTATIELTWAGDPKKPQLQIKRLICWEFLNLGGKEIAETPPSN